jgi:hypothetical protein
MMIKKLFLILLAFTITSTCVMADDETMIMRDGSTKKVKIEKISSTQISYLDVTKKKGSSHSIPVNTVYMIMREKGSNIFFDIEGNQTTSPVIKRSKKDDLIFLNKGEVFVAYNISLEKDIIKYKLKDNKKAPYNNISKKDVFMIQYSSGAIILYNENTSANLGNSEAKDIYRRSITSEESESLSQSSTELPKQNKKEKNSPKSSKSTSINTNSTTFSTGTSIVSSLPKTMGRYKVGDFYQENGLMGIVIRVNDAGDHGLIMSIERTSKKWVTGTKNNLTTNAFHEDDGEKNMKELEKFINENDGSWETFPIFAWARSLGEGWYIPAVDEVKDILMAINGDMENYNNKKMKGITKKLKDHKGDGLIDSGFRSSKFPCAMFSSTEGDAGQAITLRFKPNGLSVISPFGAPQGKFIIDNMPKNTMETGLYKVKYGTRAVHKF